MGNKEGQIQKKAGSIIFRWKKCQTHEHSYRIALPPLVSLQAHKKKSHLRCFSENTVMTLWIKASLIMGLSIWLFDSMLRSEGCGFLIIHSQPSSTR